MPFDGIPTGFQPLSDEDRASAFPTMTKYPVVDDKGNQTNFVGIRNEDTGGTVAIHTARYNIIPSRDLVEDFEGNLAQTDFADIGKALVRTDHSHGGARLFRDYLFPDVVARVADDEVALRIVLFNSYDGSMSFRGSAGFFRFVCSNGQLRGETLANLRIRHTGNFNLEDIVKSMAEAVEDHSRTVKRMEDWPSIPISYEDTTKLFKLIAKGSKALLGEFVERWSSQNNGGGQWTGGTLWDAYNVLTAWATHAPAGRGSMNYASVRADREVLVSKVIDAPAWKELEAA